MSYIPAAHTLGRRGFLFSAAAAGLATAGCSASGLSPAAWKELADALTGGTVLLPADPEYTKYSNGYNLAYPNPRPAGIANCISAANVRAAIKWCLKYDIQPTARSGGHSYAGFSMADGLLINTRGITGSYYDKATDRIWVSGGASNGDIYQLLIPLNKAITHGRCPTVGASGFLLGGGIGFNMRAHGVAIDQLDATEIVLANGEMVTASNTGPYADLFWACRGGGGGNFGINTGFWLRPYPVRDVVVFKIQWGFQNNKQMRLARMLMRHLTDAPNGLGTRLSLKARPPKDYPDQTAIDLIGQFTGDIETLMKLLDIFFRVDTPTLKQITTMPYWAGQEFLKDTDGPTRFHERSAFLKEGLDDRALDIAEGFLNKWPNGSTDDAADLRFFQTGGAMNQPKQATAFVHRNSKWLMDIGISWGARDTKQQVADNIRWQNDFYDSMLPFSTHSAYQNFIDPAETDWALAYYGPALSGLRAVKAKYDPNNLFNFAQSIKAA